MKTSGAEVVKISSPSDVICAVAQMLGFAPTESLVIICVHGPRRRLGLVMRFDLGDAVDVERFVEAAHGRVRHEQADGIFVLVFTDSARSAPMPFVPLVDALDRRLHDRLLEALLVGQHRWWSYLCADPCCGGAAGNPIDAASPGATAIAAAYAFAGQGLLPDRAAVVASIAVTLEPADIKTMRRAIVAAAGHGLALSQTTRLRLMRKLVTRLMAAHADPRAHITDDEVAEFVSLCDDVLVRDEVLIRAASTTGRDLLLPMLEDIVRRTPPPYDAPVCAMLAWVAYANGDGVIANVAVDRSLATDPGYSLALLITDSLQRQVPPRMLEEVMRGAARDLRSRNGAG